MSVDAQCAALTEELDHVGRSVSKAESPLDFDAVVRPQAHDGAVMLRRRRAQGAIDDDDLSRQHPAKQIEVVYGEIEQDPAAAVAPALPSWQSPGRRGLGEDRVHASYASDRFRPQEGAGALVSRVEPPVKPDHHGHSRVLGTDGEAPRVLDASREWLLDVHVLRGPQRRRSE